MPIPPLDALTGLLPPGVHQATIAEFQAAFGTSSAVRIELFEKFEKFIAFARTLGFCRAFLADGSYTTNKVSPGDIDGVLVLDRAGLAQLLLHAQGARLMDHAWVKATYSIDLFFSDDAGSHMVDFFQGIRPHEALDRGLPPNHKKGIVRIDL